MIHRKHQTTTTKNVKLIQAQGLENKDLIGKSDPFAKLYIRQLHSMIQTSKVIDNHLNPIWNEHFEFVIEDASTQNLTVEIHDQDRLQTSELIGCAQVKLSELDPGKVKDVWLKLVKDLDVHRDNEDKGNVHLELLYCPDGAGNEFINPFTSNLSMTLLEKVMKDGSGVENGDLVDKKTRVLITKGVLSVTVKSGEDLPPADLMGKADPFVVLTMKKTGNKNKTRVIKENLNPIWNETFDFVVEEGLHDLLIAELWDHDTFGKDYMGRCIMTLTRVILEGEYEDSFQVIGAKSGKLNLNLKWLGCEESDLELKPMATLEVKLIQGHALTNKDLIGKSDPYAKMYLGPERGKTQSSKIIDNDLNPIWNEHFEFVVEDTSTQHLTVEIYDDDGLQASELIGCAQVKLDELEPGVVKDVWLKLVENLETPKEDEDQGHVRLELLYCPNGVREMFLKEDPGGENGDVLDKKKRIVIRGVLSVTVMSAEDLPPADLSGKADPFVVLTMKKTLTKHKTSVVYQNLNPTWNETFDFVVEDGIRDMLIANIWDHDTFGKDFMGRSIVTLTRVLLEGEYEGSFQIESPKSGKLNLNLKWSAQPVHRKS
ncbi:hypothetical protein LXL04_018200 [Taraxacum kok-saghyz]